jgi:hypothetical protein
VPAKKHNKPQQSLPLLAGALGDHMSESRIISVGDHISYAMEETQEVANSCTYPVFVSAGNDKPDLIASSVAIQHKTCIYLVTASHVLNELRGMNSPFYVGVEGKFVAIEGQFTRSVSASEDDFDIAYIRLSDSFVSENKIKFVVEEKILFRRNFENFHLALIHGYPCTKNKQVKALSGGTCFKSFAFSYSGKIDKNYARWAPLRKMEEIHIGMKYGKAKDVKGEVVIPPKPQGISGGGLWIMPDSFKSTELYLAGIAIEHHKSPELVFATKIQKVIEFIEQYAAPISLV